MNNKKLLILFTTLLALVSCGDDGEYIIIERGKKTDNAETTTSTVNENRNTWGPQEAQTRYEFPQLNPAGKIIVHRAELNNKTGETGVNYCTEWAPALHGQRWSCYQMYSSINYHQQTNVVRYKADNDGSLSAECQYPNDPDLPAEYRFTADPYKYNNYDHGHICPSADRLRSTKANYQTFYITNMQPQRNKFNAGIWEVMENQVRTWASQNDTLFVCKGGTIDKESDIIEYLTDQIKHENRIPVPRYFFMAVMAKNGSKMKAIGFWVEHLNEDHSTDALRGYAMNIAQLESRTGLDFFCNVPDETEQTIENVTWSQMLSEWPFIQ